MRVGEGRGLPLQAVDPARTADGLLHHILTPCLDWQSLHRQPAVEAPDALVPMRRRRPWGNGEGDPAAGGDTGVHGHIPVARSSETHQEVLRAVARNVHLMIRHDNVAELRAYYYSKDEKLLVYDYYSRGSVSNMLHGMLLALFPSPCHFHSFFLQ